MFLLSRRLVLICGAAVVATSCVWGADNGVLRVCADPNNLPFSNQAEQGFENRLATLIAAELGEKVEYTWWAERKSFLRNSLNAGKCDAVMGVPAKIDNVSVTRPYYRSTYVTITRKDRKLHIRSLFDESLDQCKIGVHVTDADYAPPAQILARRGLAANIEAYSLFGRDGEANPPSRLIEAVRDGKVDVAIVWGPFAGYFGTRSGEALEIEPVSPSSYLGTPFTYDISVAVRKGDENLRAEIDHVLERKREAIRSLLQEFRFPLVGQGESQ